MTTSQRELAWSIGAAALLIGVALLTAFSRRLGLAEDPSLGIRLFGIFCGMLLAAYGNVIPKKLVPYEAESERPARRQACLRFCGWAFTLAGIGNAAIWAFAPFKSAAWLSMLPILLAFALVGGRIYLFRARRAA